MNEMPTILGATYGSSTANAVWPQAVGIGAIAPYKGDQFALDDQVKKFVEQAAKAAAKQQQKPKKEKVMSDRRLVRVLVVDPHKDVPTDSALLFDSKEIFTDKTDQELYFDVPMSKLLEEHNAKRAKIVDKSVKDRTEYLEPARIRDLNMLVITLAQF